MLEKSTNSYLIFILIVTGIIITILGERLVQLLFSNLIYGLSMLLIVLRDHHKGYRSLPRKGVYTILCLILVSILCSIFYHFNILSNLRMFFLIVNVLIKIGIYGYGWISTAKILMIKQKITEQTIILAITSYLFIAIIWSYLYFMVWEINPQAFHIAVPADYELKSWNLAMYFSLTTLTTLGYGDITPVDKFLMLAATFEAIAGSIYLTVIIARLVSLYSIEE